MLLRHRGATPQAQFTVDLKCCFACVCVYRKKPPGKRKQLLHQLKHPRFTAQELENIFHRNQPPGSIKYIA